MEYYAGIGSRKTPPEVLLQMEGVAALLGHRKYTLRSGGAEGADSSFERGAGKYPKQIFLPWKGFNGRTDPFYKISELAYQIAEKFHPAWHKLSDEAKALQARNSQQILGAGLDSPVDFVVCWTPDGAETETSTKTGGTGQAIRIAVAMDIPVYNLANPGRELQLLLFLGDPIF